MMKLKWIDVLRGLAIIGVIILHCGVFEGSEQLPAFMRAIIWSGKNGVQLFYVASAFTLFLSCDKREGMEKKPVLSFFVRRLFRIAPMYYIGIIFFLWKPYFNDDISNWNIVSNILFIHGVSPYWIHNLVPGGWSITVEMLFYCLVPFLFYKIKNTQQAFVFVLITLILRVILFILFKRLPLIEDQALLDLFLYFYLPNQLPIFSLGILMYFLIRDGVTLTLTWKTKIVAVLVVMAQIVSIKFMLVQLVFGICFLLLGIVLSKGYLKVLINSFLIFIGKISYSMYLIHFIILVWLEQLGMKNFIVVTTGTTAIAYYAIKFLAHVGCIAS